MTHAMQWIHANNESKRDNYIAILLIKSNRIDNNWFSKTAE